jgi:pimeloyl-ACP methyl ester carboxylesterase
VKRRIGIAAVWFAAAALLAGTGAASAAGTAATQAPANQATVQATAKPTIVLVHGAFADSSSWSSEISYLQGQGYPVLAVANPLRGVASDAAYLESVLDTINGPIVLVGHSYAGFLISQAAADDPQVKALVYVAAYIPVAGETPAALTYRDPGSLLSGTNLVTRAEPTGTDVYVNPATFGPVYAGGLSNSQIATASVVQRPIAAAAFSGPAVVDPPAATPKWEIVALDDHAIPTTTQFFMAQRAHATIVPTHSGHDVPQAQPEVVDRTILQAARAVG